MNKSRLSMVVPSKARARVWPKDEGPLLIARTIGLLPRILELLPNSKTLLKTIDFNGAPTIVRNNFKLSSKAFWTTFFVRHWKGNLL